MNDHTVLNLVKLNLKLYKIPKIICFSIAFFIFISYKIIKPLSEFSIKNGININIWDGFFKIITYPSIILCIYLPLVIVVTSILSIKIDNNQSLILRTKKKYLWVMGRLIANLIMGLLFSVIFFVSAFIVSGLFFDLSINWSSTITNTSINSNIVSELYLGNFVFSLTPIKATIIAFLELYIATCIIISLRDLLTNYIHNIYICDLIVSIYIFISIIEFMYELTIGIFNVFKYISLNTIGILTFHKFGNIKIFHITLTQSFMISLALLAILIIINLVFSKKAEVKSD